MSEDTHDNIRTLAEQFHPWMTDVRRRLHEIPEPAFEEHRTSELIAAELEAMELRVCTGVAGTGVVADLETHRSGPCMAIRADMDGLPVAEHTDVEYRSRHAGFAHCCGHDGSMATVLAAARIVRELGTAFSGRLRLIFQPAEEQAAGARAMIQAGALADPAPEAILAVHAWPDLAPETVACRRGTMLASCDEFGVKITGVGGHGARPAQANNPLGGLARLIETLNAMTDDRRVVSVCVAAGGSKANVIPETATLRGTLRALGGESRRRTRHEVEAAVADTCRVMGLTGEVSYGGYTPEVHIDPRLYELFRETAAGLLGPGGVAELPAPSMGSEDFGFYLQHVPGLMFRVGAGVDSPSLHHPAFDFNDRALTSGASVLAGMILALSERRRQ